MITIKSLPNLPHGWKYVPIVEIMNPIKTGVKQFNGQKDYYNTRSISDGSIGLPEKVTFKSKPSRANRLVIEGDVLQARMAESRKAILIDNNLSGSLFSTGFVQFRPNSKAEGEYLHLFFQSEIFLRQRDALSTGSTQVSINDKKFANILIPVPSTRLQMASICSETLNQLSVHKNISEIVSVVKPNLHKFRQSLINQLIFGNYKDSTNNKYGSEGITDDAAQLYEQMIVDREEIFLKRKPKSKYNKPISFAPSKIPTIPSNWKWVRAEEVCDFITKGTTPAKSLMNSAEANVPFIKVYNLSFDGSLDFTVNPTFISEETHKKTLTRSICYPNDILSNIVGPPLGKTSIVPDTYPEWNMNQAMVRFRPLKGLSHEFLAIYLQSIFYVNWAMGKSKATAGQFNITLEICRNAPIPLPPVSEQNLIVEIFNNAEKILTEAHILLNIIESDVGELKSSILIFNLIGAMKNKRKLDVMI